MVIIRDKGDHREGDQQRHCFVAPFPEMPRHFVFRIATPSNILGRSAHPPANIAQSSSPLGQNLFIVEDQAELFVLWGFDNIEHRDPKSGHSPLSAAVNRGHHPGIATYIRWLLKRGADLREPIRTKLTQSQLPATKGTTRLGCCCWRATASSRIVDCCSKPLARCQPQRGCEFFCGPAGTGRHHNRLTDRG